MEGPGGIVSGIVISSQRLPLPIPLSRDFEMSSGDDMQRPYYHLRGDGYKPPSIPFDKLCKVFSEMLRGYAEAGYLQKAFGYHCVDAGDVSGEKCASIATHLLIDAMIEIETPVWDHIGTLDEKQVLGMHEWLFGVIAKPLPEFGSYHSYSNCGWHYNKFDVEAGQREYVPAANRHLRLYQPGYKLTEQGELELLMEEPAATILESPLPPNAPDDVRKRVQRAVQKFRNGLSSWDDRDAAVRDLGDVRESMRSAVRQHLTRKDEGALFELLNGFSIRHMRQDQKRDYDRPIFLTWLFYEILAAIHACLRLVERGSSEKNPEDNF